MGVKDKHKQLKEVQEAMQKVVIGQQEAIDHLIITLLCNANALLESVPGLGKTTMIKALAETMSLDFARIQSTPDLMPSDITGTFLVVEQQGKQVLQFQKGPIFSNVVLADEINRATPKTQAAMLEAMQERQVTVAGTTYPLESPFFVLATQNPIDQEGTYPLPEAQTDRFLLKILIDYPSQKDEMKVVNMHTVHQKKKEKVEAILKADDVIELQHLTAQVPISHELQEDIVELVRKTREDKLIKMGASTRASIGLVMAAKAHAFLHERSFVAREDVLAMAAPVLRHRILLTFEAEEQSKNADSVITELAKKIVTTKR
ncbi:MAG: AAA family ATPase [Candidatus Woesearchaeota archaeon]